MSSSNVYGSVYSGIPVYEFQCKGIAVMRRKVDGYLNATQILKVAGVEKGRRTKILEREIQVSGAIYEKVQGGYGKYQGTWVPYERGVEVAERYGVTDLLSELLQFEMGGDDSALFTTSPNKKRKLSNASLVRSASQPTISTTSQPQQKVAVQLPVISQSQPQPQILQPPPQPHQQYLPPRPVSSNNEKYRAMLMSVFLSHDSNKVPAILQQRGPPADLDPDMIIDDQGHSALHWASALARINILHMLIANLGADVTRVNFKGESALVRAILVTNCYESDCFGALLAALGDTVLGLRDKKGRTVLHHIMLTAGVKGRAQASRYYLEQLLAYIRDSEAAIIEGGDEVAHSMLEALVDLQDKNGDSALNMAARLGNKQLVELLIESCGADISLPNNCGLRPLDFGLEDVLLRPIFERRLVAQKSGAPITLLKPSEIPQPMLSSDFVLAGANQNSSSFQHKTRQLSQEFEGVVQTLEQDLNEKDKRYQDAVAQIHVLSNELSEGRRLISKLSSRVLELQKQLGQDTDGLIDARFEEEHNMSREQILERRCGQFVAILQSNGITVDVNSLSQMQVPTQANEPQQRSKINMLLAEVLDVDLQCVDENFAGAVSSALRGQHH